MDIGQTQESDEDDSGRDLGIRNAKARLDYGDRWFVEERLLFFGFFGDFLLTRQMMALRVALLCCGRCLLTD